MIDFSLVLSIDVENFNQRKLNKKVIEKVINRLGLEETYQEFKKAFRYSHNDAFLIRGLSIPSWRDWVKSLSLKDKRIVINTLNNNSKRLVREFDSSFEDNLRLQKEFLNYFLPELYHFDSMSYFQEVYTGLQVMVELNIDDIALLQELSK